MDYYLTEIVGKVYGKLTVIEVLSLNCRNYSYDKVVCRCRCECGNMVLRTFSKLERQSKSKKIISCGCVELEKKLSKM